MENYVILALVMIGVWVAGFVVYLILSNRQRDIETEIDQVNKMLETKESGDVAG